MRRRDQGERDQLVREIATMGGDVTKFVSPSVKRWLDEKLAKTPRD